MYECMYACFATRRAYGIVKLPRCAHTRGKVSTTDLTSSGLWDSTDEQFFSKDLFKATMSFPSTNVSDQTCGLTDASTFNENTTNEGITLLDVPYGEKDEAKTVGAQWNAEERSWFAPPGTDLSPLQRWIRVYLRCAFAEKDEVKGLGAKWDPRCKAWYISMAMDSAPFERWLRAEP